MHQSFGSQNLRWDKPAMTSMVFLKAAMFEKWYVFLIFFPFSNSGKRTTYKDMGGSKNGDTQNGW